MIKRALAIAILVPAAATAGPAGEKVIKGEATFTRDGSLTQITTSTRKTIVNYSSFDIGRGETVRIDQPTARSRILNNVFSTDPTRIDVGAALQEFDARRRVSSEDIDHLSAPGNVANAAWRIRVADVSITGVANELLRIRAG